ncbi:hypothetical protein E2C01_009832 [Portunus trituberculatus]|uniref:Uncharacterized protein n=1 Tax=Portunus trituberculatus TaxID=210409 RepID=A0A5B7D6T3_PORTR|nr:hypothetical protein [Portunus trituberculatus]
MNRLFRKDKWERCDEPRGEQTVEGEETLVLGAYRQKQLLVHPVAILRVFTSCRDDCKQKNRGNCVIADNDAEADKEEEEEEEEKEEEEEEKEEEEHEQE